MIQQIQLKTKPGELESGGICLMVLLCAEGSRKGKMGSGEIWKEE